MMIDQDALEASLKGISYLPSKLDKKQKNEPYNSDWHAEAGRLFRAGWSAKAISTTLTEDGFRSKQNKILSPSILYEWWSRSKKMKNHSFPKNEKMKKVRISQSWPSKDLVATLAASIWLHKEAFHQKTTIHRCIGDAFNLCHSVEEYFGSDT